MPLFPAAPVLALIGMAGVMWVSFADPREGRPGLVATAVVIVISIGIHAMLRRNHSPWADRGPGRASAVANTDSAIS